MLVSHSERQFLTVGESTHTCTFISWLSRNCHYVVEYITRNSSFVQLIWEWNRFACEIFTLICTQEKKLFFVGWQFIIVGEKTGILHILRGFGLAHQYLWPPFSMSQDCNTSRDHLNSKRACVAKKLLQIFFHLRLQAEQTFLFYSNQL